MFSISAFTFDLRPYTEAPKAELELEHVYGYAGLENTAPNLYYLRSGEVVYYTAAVGLHHGLHSSTVSAQLQPFLSLTD